MDQKLKLMTMISSESHSSHSEWPRRGPDRPERPRVVAPAGPQGPVGQVSDAARVSSGHGGTERAMAVWVEIYGTERFFYWQVVKQASQWLFRCSFMTLRLLHRFWTSIMNLGYLGGSSNEYNRLFGPVNKFGFESSGATDRKINFTCIQ